MRIGALLVFALGCAQPPPPPPERAAPASLPPVPTIRVHVDVGLGSAFDVVAGIRSWARATRGWREWELAGPATAHAYITEVDPTDSPCQVTGYTIAGCAEAIGGLDDDEAPHAQIWLMRGNYEASAQWVTMHELGHALGLTHMDGTLMQGRGRFVLLTLDCPDDVTLMRMHWRTGYPMRCR